MQIAKSAALAAALAVAAGAGAAVTPVAHGQAETRPARALEIVSGVGGSQIGVSIRDVDPADTKAGQAGGVLIEEVTADSPAAQAGVKKGDVIVEFDGERVRSARQFSRLVQETVPGRKVQAVAMRDGQRTTLTVEPREHSMARLFGDFDRLRDLDLSIARVPAPPVPPRPARPAPAPMPMLPDMDAFVWTSGNVLGITTGDLSPQLAEYFGAKEGVLVNSVTDDSAAAKAGLKAGDVVTAINGTTVARPSELRREIQRLRAGDAFTLQVMRDKKPQTVKGTVEERRDRRRTFRSIV
jgi:S1-C subfamily serine protease